MKPTVKVPDPPPYVRPCAALPQRLREVAQLLRGVARQLG